MSRQHSRPYWQNNVLHVPTSPFMSPVASPSSSPLHSPFTSPPQTPSHVSDNFANAPDVAGVLLESIHAWNNGEHASEQEVPTGEDLFSDEAREEHDADDESQHDQNNESVDESVQRAYNRFLEQVFHTEHTASLSQNESHEQSTPSSPPPPPNEESNFSRRESQRSPTMRRQQSRGQLFVRQRPPQLLVERSNNREAIVPLPNGGFTYAARSPIIITRQNIGGFRQMRRARTRADLPLVRQYAANATRVSRRRATERIVRFSTEIRSYQAQNRAQQFASDRNPPSFQLTEDVGIPVDKCAICLEEYKINDYVSYISCQPNDHSKDHMFHSDCINEWVCSLRRNGSYVRTCPVCRGEF